MTPEELRLANAELMRRRNELGVRNRPRPLETVVARVAGADQPGPDLGTYWQKLKAGESTGSESFALSTNSDLWRSFDDERHPDLASGVRLIKGWYNDLLPAGRAIVLAGGVGSGKTHLARAIHQHYGPRSVFWNEVMLLAAIRAGYNSTDGESEEMILRRISRAELFILDDLGSYDTNSMAWLQNIYNRIFDARCGDLDHLRATMVTSNLRLVTGDRSPVEERLGPRAFDRLMGAVGQPEFYIDLFNVPSYRTRKF